MTPDQARTEAHMTQQELADAAGIHRHTLDMVEHGWRRPTTVTTWRLARALRPRGTLRDRVALDERLRQAAGSSLRYSNTRPHRRREAVREELRAEAGGGQVLEDHDTGWGAAILAELSSAAIRQGPAGQPDHSR
jgi:DNA-binding XRE family transcriptional regulator